MKKIFTLFAAMLIAFTASAKPKEIGPKTGYDTHDNLRLALYYATAGDTILLTSDDTIYVEKDDYLYFDKDVVIMAAEGKKPVIGMYTYAQIKNNANVKIKGLKFDGGQQGLNGSSYSYYFRFYDNSKTSLVLEDCEFYGVKEDIFYTDASHHADSLIINNCYFYNGARGAIYFAKSSNSGTQTCDKLVIKNSTFANFTTMDGHHLIEVNNYGSTVTSDIRTVVDHCTFYNYGVSKYNFNAIYSYKSTNVSVTNCIFSNDTIANQRATWLYGGSVSNCLVNNVINKDYAPQATVTNGITANPLFEDVTKGYQLKGNWVTMQLSPARGAASDGTDLGDPRWHTAEVLPEVDFEEPYVCGATKALLGGRISLVNNDSLVFNHNSNTADGVAKWKMHITKAGFVSVQLNLTATSSSGHKIKVELLDANNNPIDSVLEAATSWSGSNINLSGKILIPSAGDYTIKMSNATFNSSSRIKGITLTYYSNPKTIYLKAGVWDKDKAQFAVQDKTTATWSKFMTSIEDDVYTTTIPDDGSQLKFARCADAETSTVPGASIWNSVDNVPRADGKDVYVISDWSAGWWSEYYPAVTSNGYYLVGTHNSWNPTNGDKFTTKTSDDPLEFSFTKDAAEGDKFKAMEITSKVRTGWYPDGTDNEYTITAALAGNVTIYFRPGGNDSWSDANGGGKKFYVVRNGEPTSIDSTVVGEKAVKRIVNGQLFIEKDGRIYNILGSRVK